MKRDWKFFFNRQYRTEMEKNKMHIIIDDIPSVLVETETAPPDIIKSQHLEGDEESSLTSDTSGIFTTLFYGHHQRTPMGLDVVYEEGEESNCEGENYSCGNNSAEETVVHDAKRLGPRSRSILMSVTNAGVEAEENAIESTNFGLQHCRCKKTSWGRVLVVMVPLIIFSIVAPILLVGPGKSDNSIDENLSKQTPYVWAPSSSPVTDSASASQRGGRSGSSQVETITKSSPPEITNSSTDLLSSQDAEVTPTSVATTTMAVVEPSGSEPVSNVADTFHTAAAAPVKLAKPLSSTGSTTDNRNFHTNSPMQASPVASTELSVTSSTVESVFTPKDLTGPSVAENTPTIAPTNKKVFVWDKTSENTVEIAPVKGNGFVWHITVSTHDHNAAIITPPVEAGSPLASVETQPHKAAKAFAPMDLPVTSPTVEPEISPKDLTLSHWQFAKAEPSAG